MTDICKCSGEREVDICPLRRRCHRFLADSDPVFQSYFRIAPFDGGKCDYFWKRIKNGKNKTKTN